MNNKLKSIDTQITFNPMMFDNTEERTNILDLTLTIGHETFLHAYNKAFLAAFMFDAKHFEETLNLLKRDTGEGGKVDHGNWINNVLDGEGTNGISLFNKFLEELGETPKDKKIVKKLVKKEKKKYANLKDENK